jgi:mRNA interferase RelE/StbE
MKYELLYANLANRQLKKLPKDVSARILEKLRGLADGFQGDVKKLSDHSPEYRLRVGEYRVLFDLEGNRIIVQAVRNRREAY